jgi:hypothetical protein
VSIRKIVFLASICLGAAAVTAEVSVAADTLLINHIADEGFNHSQVAETAEYLADQIGGRMTNSPAMRRAEQWSQEKFKGWGLKNVHTEGFDFGRGWWIESSSVRMVSPRPLELRAFRLPGPLQRPVR